MAKQQYAMPSNIPSQVVSLCEQHVGLFDTYVLYQTGQREYTCYVMNTTLDKFKTITVYRPDNQSYWQVREGTFSESEFPTAVTLDYYSYSNRGFGQSFDLTVQTNTITAVSVMGIFLILALKTMFFAWLERGEKR